MASETAALSSFENTVTHVCAHCDYDYHVSGFTVRIFCTIKYCCLPIISITNICDNIFTLLQFTVGHYLERIQSDKHYKVKHITSSAEFDMETFQKILKKVKIPDNCLDHILYKRCFKTTELETEINTLLNTSDPEKQVDMLVIEDLCDLFNFDFFKDDTRGKYIYHIIAVLENIILTPANLL